jgi:hypothetical protein
MDYMGFHDLFDHLLDTKSVRDKHDTVTKTSSVLSSRSLKQHGPARNSRKAALQPCKSFHALKKNHE